ncbi:MAG: glycosyltransferase [Bacteroidota bacterium]|jgi:glycosyltransferase involved in cell wall biosynthesis|nr:glycosyltransferase [Bacteroidota bacterium]
MHVTIVYKGKIPTKYYGGTARDIWYLGKELVKLGNKVTYLVDKGSFCPFADIIYIDKYKNINEQIPKETDIVNLHSEFDEEIEKPFLLSVHGNTNNPNKVFPINTNFVSQNHASRYGAEAFVYNGIDWADYPEPNFSIKRNGYHFLGKAAWRVKNLKAAIKIAKKNKKPLEVMGGKRVNFSMGIRITLNPNIHFHGMVDDIYKAEIMNKSEALLFPVLWHEPMGLAVIESLYYGCPIIATPYGSLPEIVGNEFGFYQILYQI